MQNKDRSRRSEKWLALQYTFGKFCACLFLYSIFINIFDKKVVGLLEQAYVDVKLVGDIVFIVTGRKSDGTLCAIVEWLLRYG